MDKATASLVLTAIGSFACILSALFSYPQWAKWRQQRRQQQPRGVAVSRGFRWVGFGTAFAVSFIATAVAGEGWLYFGLYVPGFHTRIYWAASALLALAVVGLWWLLTYTMAGAMEQAASARADASSLKRNYEERIEHLAKSHEAEFANRDSFVKDAQEEAHNLRKLVEQKDAELAALAESIKAAERFTLSPLQQDAFRCAAKLRDWIAAVGPLATPPAIAGESDEERDRRTISAWSAYSARIRFQYESGHRDEVQRIYRAFAAENIRDPFVEQFLGGGRNATRMCLV